MKFIKIIFSITLLSIVNLPTIASTLAPELTTCAAIKKANQRLECFDKYIIKHSNITSKNNQLPTLPAEIPAKNEQLISSFGQAHKYSEEERSFDKMTAIVTSAKRNLHKKWKIKLDNGQVWIEKGGDKRAKFSEGDSIVIMRGIMNSFQLKKVGTKRRIRVNRIL